MPLPLLWRVQVDQAGNPVADAGVGPGHGLREPGGLIEDEAVRRQQIGMKMDATSGHLEVRLQQRRLAHRRRRGVMAPRCDLVLPRSLELQVVEFAVQRLADLPMSLEVAVKRLRFLQEIGSVGGARGRVEDRLQELQHEPGPTCPALEVG